MTLNVHLLQNQVFGPLNHGLAVTEPRLTILPGSVKFGQFSVWLWFRPLINRTTETLIRFFFSKIFFRDF